MDNLQFDQVLFSIAEVSKMIDVVPATIRNWEKESLITPKRKANGYRVYDFHDIEHLKKIKQYSSDNIGLTAIKIILGKEEEERPQTGDVPYVSKKMLGKRWKDSRLEKGLSIDDVAKATEISPSYLSKIENAQANVSYDILQKIAAFYGENVLYYYVSQNHTPNLVRKNQGEKFTIDIPGVFLETIATGHLGVVKYTIEPNSGRTLSQSHKGSELVYILSGEIDYTLNENNHYTLHQGDAFHFNSSIHHRWFNSSGKETTLLWMYISDSEEALAH